MRPMKTIRGGIDATEFTQIIDVLCAQILFRMLAYYLVLILCVPYISTKVVDAVKIPNGSYAEMAAEQCISMSLFFLVIPNIWNTIDEHTEKRIIEKVSAAASSNVNDDDDTAATTTTTTTTNNIKSETDKKDD